MHFQCFPNTFVSLLLYDNAQLVDLLTRLWRTTKNPIYAARIAATIDWLVNEMQLPDGGFAASLDADSEGLLVLTNSGRLQHRLTNPRFGHWRSYWAQVEGVPQQPDLQRLRQGVQIKGQITLPAKARWLAGTDEPQLDQRKPPIRYRASIPTSWLELSLKEGRNRQVRRMTAAVGLPTLRLVRCRIDLMDGEQPLNLQGLRPGEWRTVTTSEQQRLTRLLGNEAPDRHHPSKK